MITSNCFMRQDKERTLTEKQSSFLENYKRVNQNTHFS